MTRLQKNRRGNKRRNQAGAQTKLPQLPWRQVVNPYRPLEILNGDQLEAIHLSSMRILEELGIEVVSDRALDLLVAAGVDVDRSAGVVRHFNAVHLIGNQVVAPIEMPANSRHLDTYNANLTYSELTFMLSAIGKGRFRNRTAAPGLSLVGFRKRTHNTALLKRF